MMIKISEKLDLSRKVLDIDITSPVFENMLFGLNEEIQRVIKCIYNGEFASGEISVKLDLKLVNAVEEFAKDGGFGEMITELYKYKRPKFEHKITSTLKKQYKQEGIYEERKEVVWDEYNEKYMVKPLVNPQIEFEELRIIENESGEETNE